ncbi:ATPase domain-containing protein [Thermocrinis sp.]
MGETESRPDLSAVYTGSQAIEEAPEIYGVSTGIEGLDGLFFVVKPVGKRLEKVSLNGIPSYSVMNITGVSDTGKSLMVEQFTVFRASQGDIVVFITVETPANFTNVVAEEVARALDVPWAYMVLRHVKGVKYPIQDSSVLKEKLKGLKIKTHPAEEIVEKLTYPIKTPAVLLHEIKLVLLTL